MQARVSPEQHVERLRFRRAPLAAAAIWFALGILLARLSPHSTLQLMAALLLLAVLTVAATTRIALLPLAALWIALGIAAADWQPQPPSKAALLARADNLSRMILARGERVRGAPIATVPKTRIVFDPTAR